jgi:hypothetical protein
MDSIKVDTIEMFRDMSSGVKTQLNKPRKYFDDRVFAGTTYSHTASAMVRVLS